MIREDIPVEKSPTAGQLNGFLFAQGRYHRLLLLGFWVLWTKESNQLGRRQTQTLI